MVGKKFFGFKIIIVLVLVAMVVFCGIQVRASDDYDGELVGYFEYNGQQIPYYYLNSFKRLNYKYNGETISFVVSRPTYFLFVQTSSSRYLQTFSFEEYFAQWTFDISGNKFGDYSVKNTTVAGEPLWYGSMTLSSSYEVPFDFYNVSSASGCYNAFMSYMVSELFVPYEPDSPFDYTYAADSAWSLKNFSALIDEDILSCSWGRLNKFTYAAYENSLLRFSYILYPRAEVASDTKPIIFKKEKPISLNDFSYDVALANIGVNESYYLYKVMATPYYYENDDPEGQLISCKTSSVYFNEEAQVIRYEVADSNFSETLPPAEEDVDMTLLERVTSFFGSFFSKLGDLIYNLIIPDKNALLALLNDMQDWFADKFGFLWYPFDLAIQIVEAFTMGSADSNLKIPACTLNLGSSIGIITLWQEQYVDLDPVGLAEYVRFFTSAIICCNVAFLAWKKFDEVMKGGSA